jgi:phosphoglycerate kinase
MQKMTLESVSVRGKKVLMRVDFNVPMERGEITDDARIVAALPSINYVLREGGALILMSHLGRPKGKVVKELTLAPCARRLAELLQAKVAMAPDCIGGAVEELAEQLQSGEVLMLENLRFHPGEEDPKGHPAFVSALAKLGEIYVNDAFGTAHRYHASTAAIASFFPHCACAGLLLEKEMEFLGKVLNSPARPFYAIIGGAKISTKIGTLTALMQKADRVMVGGAMAYTFFKAQGVAVGNSLHEDDQIARAHSLLVESERLGGRLLLPSDTLIADTISERACCKVVDSMQGIPDGWEGVDIGPATTAQYMQQLHLAKTILWNGPLGIFEIEPFANGTMAMARALAQVEATTIVGGGDSLAAIQKAGVASKITHLSTGGGACLEYIEFGTLPGIEALSPA